VVVVVISCYIFWLSLADGLPAQQGICFRDF